jgi:hypothetical protein
MSLCAQINRVKKQKLQQQILFPDTPSRIDSLRDSPYSETQNNTTLRFQLDMRRKAEVLKYDVGNTKTNNLTKKESFALVMRGSAPPISKGYIDANSNESAIRNGILVLNCNNKNLPFTSPSSACGVPNDYRNGINTLYCDPTVPLYNYINPILTRSYGIINSSEPITVIRYSNYRDTTSKVSTIEFTDNAVNPSYVVNILNIPLGIQIYGDISSNSEHVSLDPILINSTLFQLNTYYEGELVTPNSTYIYTFTPNNNNCIVDVSSNTAKDGDTFSATAYIGMLSISNIALYASPGYLYDFHLTSSLITTSTYSRNNLPFLKNITANIIYNISSSYLVLNSQYNNCVIRFSPVEVTIPDTLGTFTVNTT